MRIWKTLLLLLLALCMCVSLLAACATKEPDGEEEEGEGPGDTTPTPDGGEGEGPCAGGHLSGPWLTVLQPTMTEPGRRQQTCSRCGEIIATESVPALSQELFENINFSEKTTTVDLSKYTLVYPDFWGEDLSFTTTYVNELNAFADRLSAVTGATFTAYQEKDTPSEIDDPEILVGVTSRPDSEEMAESFRHHGYGIQVKGNKILIQGTTNLLTLKAVELFVNKYLMVDGTKTEFALHDFAKTAGMEVTVIGDVNGMPYVIVRSDDLDEDPTSEYGSDGGKAYYDYLVDASGTLKTKFRTLTGLADERIKLATDAQNGFAKELLLGFTNRADTAECLSKLQGHEYGMFFYDHDRIVLTAWNDTNMKYCLERFMDYLSESRYYAEGSYQIVFPADFTEIGCSNDAWQTNFPRPDYLPLRGSFDANDNSVEYVYMGEGVNVSAYLGYRNVLLQNGYTVLMQQENVEGSYFATLVNAEKKISLNIAYNAFAHADELPEGGKYANAEPTLRIMSSNLDYVNLPTQAMTQFTPFTQAREPGSSLTAVALPDGSVGTGYVLRLEDGSFIVMDGGNPASGTEVENLWNILSFLHEMAWGSAPSVENPIRISAWIISHSHGDHTYVFDKFSYTYGKTGLVKLEYLLGNFPTAISCYNVPESNTAMTRYMSTYQSYYTEPFTFIKVHTGQKLWFANVEVEVLFTPEDFYPHRIVAFNDSSSVVRLKVYNTNGEQMTPNSQPATFIATGDAYRYSGRWMCAMYGDYLKSDMVALAHHGGPGTEAFFYTKVAATALWCPNTAAGFNSWVSRKDWIGEANREAAKAKYVITANYYSNKYKNATVNINANGPDYDNAYNAGGQGSIQYCDNSVIWSGAFPNTSYDIGKRKK